MSAHPGIAVPGWLAVQTRRHVARLAELDDRESGSLGVVLRDASTWLESATGADRTYTYALGEGVRHVHIMVGVPQSANQADRGAQLLSRILNRDPSLEQPRQRDSVTAETARIARTT